MKLTFTPAPDSPCRVLAADDPQPQQSWAAEAPNKLIAPKPTPNTLANPPHPANQSTAEALPAPPMGPAPTEPPSQAKPAGTNAPDFLEPLARGCCPGCPDRPLLFQARQQANYYRAMFRAAKLREADKDAHIANLQAEIRILKQRLFGKKSEARHRADQPKTPSPQDPLAETAKPGPTAAAKPRRKRGQQKGNPIPKRRDYSHLPLITEERLLPEQQAHCSCCGKPFSAGGYEENSEIIEVEVQAYRRRIRRRRYLRTCSCPDLPKVVAAPIVPRLLPHSPLGISVWVQILLDKYRYCRATHKQLEDLRDHGLDLASGTVIGGLKRLARFFEPVYEKLAQRSREQALWNADETRWPVFQVVKGKVGHRWQLWLFESKDSVVFTLDKGRAHDVPEKHFGEKARGIVVVDRYSAYKAIKHVKEGRLRLAFCWAHQRRDFLNVEKSWPKLSDWASGWVRRIAELYKCNDERLKAQENSGERKQKDQKLRQTAEAMQKQMEAELAQQKQHPAVRTVLKSLNEHWQGLTIFVDEPSVPMDNNQGERTLRIAALCRKNYYGSGAQWSGKLAAWMFSIVGTLKKHGLNPRKWLMAYLGWCAEAAGEAPEDVERWLPWNLTAQQQKDLAQQEEPAEESQPKG